MVGDARPGARTHVRKSRDDAYIMQAGKAVFQFKTRCANFSRTRVYDYRLGVEHFSSIMHN